MNYSKFNIYLTKLETTRQPLFNFLKVSDRFGIQLKFWSFNLWYFRIQLGMEGCIERYKFLYLDLICGIFENFI